MKARVPLWYRQWSPRTYHRTQKDDGTSVRWQQRVVPPMVIPTLIIHQVWAVPVTNQCEAAAAGFTGAGGR